MKFNPLEQVIERIFWLIRLRWLAVIGVFATVFVVSELLNFNLPVLRLYIVSAALAVYNLLFLILLNHQKIRKSWKYVNGIANAQIALDLLSLTCLIHFSGGIENPFILYFIFHMIIASILLSRRASFLQASFAATLFCLVIMLEYAGIISHNCLSKFIIHDQHRNSTYILGVSFVFISTLYIAVYMATSISGKLRERENGLASANALLEEKDRIKSEYVLRVTHDIKEHIGAIQSCLYPVNDRITGDLNSQQSDLIQRASERAGKLMFFVKALLEITRIKLTKEIKMDIFSLRDTILDAISFISQKADTKGVIVKYDIAPSIDKMKGIQGYIQETISNILANAVKYTPQGGIVELKAVDADKFIHIIIADNGIGIPKQEMPRIFEEFYRASNAKKTEKDGTGLGLSLAKQVVDMHKGKIWIESEEGKGAAINIEIPKYPL